MSIFTQRHYEWLAAYVKGREWSQEDILHLANALASENPRFSMSKFLGACISDGPMLRAKARPAFRTYP